MLYWNSQQFLTGIESIDRQHMALFKILNDFHEGSSHGIDQDKVLEMLQFLEEYARNHFNDEEALMAQYQYPGIEEQKEFHRIFIADSAEFRREYEASGANLKLAISIFSRLGNWLAEHISMMDKTMGEYIKTRQGM